MTDHRRLKKIAARYDVDVSRQRDPLRRRRRLITWAAGLGSVALAVAFWFGDHRTFQARPVAAAHASFEQNCQTCHDRNWAVWERLTTLDNNVHSVSDARCQQCHAETNADHLRHAGAVEVTMSAHAGLFEGQACAGCHQEHRGRTRLTQTPDARCTNCHQQVTSEVFELAFSQWDAHPDWSIFRAPAPGSSGDTDHPATAQHASAQKVIWDEGAAHDASAFHFNHHRHLAPELPAGGGQRRTLQCQDCHERDAAGAYYLPIRYDQHCQSCHALGVTATGPLPHQSPDILRGLLLDRVSRHSADVGAASATRESPLTNETVAAPPELAVTASSIEELRKIVAEWEVLLFGGGGAASALEEPTPAGVVQATCVKCHVTEQGDAGEWRITPPRIPERWFAHARFRHDRHDALDCQVCHQRAGVHTDDDIVVSRNDFYPRLPESLREHPAIYASTTAADVLLPGIAVCKSCHGGGQTVSGAGAASGACVECHAYHHETISSEGGADLGQLLLPSLRSRSAKGSAP